ncbi:hypothetical protein RIF29_40890 [Crotalaria pallida]|uniref:Uncharacterized protein n=1 Tax=Crotalaria pallida TaxID=3830 RepID=A0AAN9HUQ3_CROPI
MCVASASTTFFSLHTHITSKLSSFFISEYFSASYHSSKHQYYVHGIEEVGSRKKMLMHAIVLSESYAKQ